MSDMAVDKFAEHVKTAAMEIIQYVPMEHPNFREEATELGTIILSVFSTPDFMHAVQRWMTIGGMVHSYTSCDCGDDAKHAFLARCDNIMTGHTMTWQIETFRQFLMELDIDEATVEVAVEAMAKKMSARITEVEEVEVPDYVPSDWDNNGN